MSGPNKDNIYAEPHAKVGDFTFDQKVVEVFPDMIQRSVPGYATIISTIGEIAQRFVQPNSTLYDLGCSLGAATLAMRRNVDHHPCQIIAIDNSAAMIERCQLHIDGFRSSVPVNVVQADINDVDIIDASVVVMNFTLQFIAPEKRQAMIDKIYQGLRPGGVLVLSEKLRFEDEHINDALIDLHHEFKRANGYSELEISQKRSSLENVMKIDTPAHHRQRCEQAGFSHFTQWYQCFNFCSMFAIK